MLWWVMPNLLSVFNSIDFCWCGNNPISNRLCLVTFVIFVVNFVPVCALISYKSDPVVTKFHPAVCGFVCVYVRACLIVVMVSGLMLWRFSFVILCYMRFLSWTNNVYQHFCFFMFVISFVALMLLVGW